MSHFLIRFLLTNVLVIGLVAANFGQSFKAFKKAGEEALKNRDFYTAMIHYRDAIKIKPKEINVAFQLAEAARHFKAYETAEKYYLKVLRSKERKNYTLVNHHLASVYKSMGKYQLAKDYFEDFLNQNDSGNSLFKKLAEEEIKSCNWAIALMENPEKVEIIQLDKKINSPYSDFGALQKGDTLFYSSFRFENDGDEHKPPRKITKLLYSLNGKKGRPMRYGFNEETKHTAHSTISGNGRRIYFTICDYENANKINCALYFREKDKRGRWRGKPIPLPASINKKGATTTHPSLGYDSTEQKELLFFASDREGGQGGMDIWVSTILPESNQFTEPIPVEKLNTSFNEITPFFHTESQVLYFSSDRLPGLGGYDIYKSTENYLTPSQIIHLGTPVNTSYNDLYFSLNKIGDIGFISSNRPGAIYLDEDNKACCNDIFQVIWPTAIETIEVKKERMPIVTPVLPELEAEAEISSTVPPEKLEDYLPLALYFDNDEPDKATRSPTTRQNYSTTFFQYYDRKEEYMEKNASTLLNVFFEEEVKRGHNWLLQFSKILLTKLKEGETVEIFIKGFTSPRAQSDYNLFLGKRRISSIRNHFKDYENGLLQSFIAAGKLKITERSFGESTASDTISDVLEDQRNSIYSVEAAKERRVEIIEIKREK